MQQDNLKQLAIALAKEHAAVENAAVWKRIIRHRARRQRRGVGHHI